jgi:hypothetical protein
MTAFSALLHRFSHITLNSLAAGLLAGFFAGTITGLVSRIAMRIIAVALGMELDFSLEGTFMLVFAGLFFGAIIGVVYSILEGFINLPNIVKGLLAGVAVLILNLIPIAFGEPEGELVLLPPIYFAGAFLPVYLVFGLVLAYTAAWFDEKLKILPKAYDR